MQKIIKLDFKKTNNETDTASYNNLDLTDSENLKNIKKYILPIIAENEGWGTKELTYEGFEKNPFQYQDELDSTLFSNVHVALDDKEKPIGLLEYLEETISNPISHTRMNNLIEIIENKDKWNELTKMEIINSQVVDKFFPQLEGYISNKKLYSEIGIVVKAGLQGKRTGIAESLYQKLTNGILFAWTNNPLLIAQWRKYFTNVLYFPLLSERIESLEGLASLAILYADLLTYDKKRWINLKFGSLSSPYFVSSRNSFYLELAKTLATKGKITKLDEERLSYFISKKSVQGAVFTFS